jgi:DNA-binding transcriptional ArsR family regulator
MKTGAEELSLTFAALADPTRRAILERLRAGEATLGGPLDNAAQWLLRYREVWEGSLDRLDGYLDELQQDRRAS